MGNHNFKSIIKEGNAANVKEFLSHEPDMKNHTYRYGWNACHLAVEYHKLDILKYLMEETDADYKHVDNAQSNLLHHALHHAEAHFDIVQYLLDSGKFQFDGNKDEHENSALHLAFQFCSLKEIAELSKYYKGLKDLFQEKNKQGLTPLGILEERCKSSPESLAIVEQLRHQIEKESPNSSKHNSDEEKGERKKSSDLKKSSTEHKTRAHDNHHEEKEEDKKHSDEESGNQKHHKKHSSDDKKHSDEDQKHSSDDKKHSDEEHSNKKHHHHHKKHNHDEDNHEDHKKHHHHHHKKHSSGEEDKAKEHEDRKGSQGHNKKQSHGAEDKAKQVD